MLKKLYIIIFFSLSFSQNIGLITNKSNSALGVWLGTSLSADFGADSFNDYILDLNYISSSNFEIGIKFESTDLLKFHSNPAVSFSQYYSILGEFYYHIKSDDYNGSNFAFGLGSETYKEEYVDSESNFKAETKHFELIYYKNN